MANKDQIINCVCENNLVSSNRKLLQSNNNGKKHTQVVSNKTIKLPHSKLQLLHQNIQSIKNKVPEIEVFLDTLEEKPNILCFTEHWLKPAQEEFLKIQGFEMISCFSRMEMLHGGACIYIKETLHFEEVLCIKNKSVEGHIECACVQNKDMKTIIVCIYRTNLGDFNVFIEKLEKILETILVKFKKYKLILCGDFNLNLLEKNNQTTIFLDLLRAYDISQTIFEPTRVTKLTSTLLDNIFVNFNDYEESTVVISALSDHHAQIIYVQQNELNEGNIGVSKRVFTKKKLQQYRQELESVIWDNVLNLQDTNEAYNIFINSLQSIMYRIFPKKKVKFKSKSNNWITKGIKVSCKKKRLLFKQLIAGQIASNIYKEYTLILKKVIKHAKKLANSEFILNAENKTKATWSLIKNITGKSNTTDNSNIFKNFESSGSNSLTLLNNANNYFINACPDTNTEYEINYEIIKQSTPSIFLKPASTQEVYNCIKHLKNKKSVGHDEIPICLLKEVAELIIYPLTHIINLIFCTGIYPEGLKTTYIKAIYKKGEKDKFKNYRPISLLSNVGKIIEKLIYERIENFLATNSILSDCQNGFRKGKSTIRALYQAMVKILESLNNDKKTITMSLDLSKAFDSVDHNILCRKLNLYGIRGVASRLIESYLENRKQCVIEMGKNGEMQMSDTVTIKKGVPQGSVLGPLLYILYTNELPIVVDQTMILYADDTSLVFSEADIVSCQTKIAESLNIMDAWFSANNLMLNVEKTQLMCFSNRSSETFDTNFRNTILKSTNNIRFLGVYIDQRLDWRHQIEKLAQYMARYCYALKILAQNIGIREALTAYHAYIHSKIKYGIIFWGNSVEIQRILVLQKRCLRNIFNMKQSESCKRVFIDNKILTIISLYIYMNQFYLSWVIRNCFMSRYMSTTQDIGKI